MRELAKAYTQHPFPETVERVISSVVKTSKLIDGHQPADSALFDSTDRHKVLLEKYVSVSLETREALERAASLMERTPKDAPEYDRRWVRVQELRWDSFHNRLAVSLQVAFYYSYDCIEHHLLWGR